MITYLTSKVCEYPEESFMRIMNRHTEVDCFAVRYFFQLSGLGILF